MTQKHVPFRYDYVGSFLRPEELKVAREKFQNNEITKEALEDWKANYLDGLKKDYVPFEESNLKRFNNSMSVKVPPEIK